MASQNFQHWITFEEHHKSGGIGSAILEWATDNNIKFNSFTRIGVNDHFIHRLGNQNFTRVHEGIDSNNLVKIVESL